MLSSEIWDADPWLLGTPGGTVDLKTGELRPARKEDHITKIAAVAPADKEDCPRWKKFLSESTGKDDEVIKFIQQWNGYTLTGDTREHALVFVYGPGGNGKSVWLNTSAFIMADYCKTAAMESFTASQHPQHTPDLAMLQGARMVCASETEEGKAWAEVRIKQLTGGDIVTARFMRMDFFEYRPQFKLTIIGNYRPELHNVDDATRRRFNVLPFVLKPSVVDKELETKLRQEAPGILRWMINGCLDWQKNGLVRPKAVLDATAEYFTEQDTLKQWMEDSCQLGPTTYDTKAALFKSWSDYAAANGERAGSTKGFCLRLSRLGFKSLKNTPGKHGKKGFEGIQVALVNTSKQHHNREECPLSCSNRHHQKVEYRLGYLLSLP